jgi:solute carrier family 8 (sodium/calcium exchanger)
VKESIGMARIPIVRSGGADGEVSVMWRTKDKSAIGGKDYVGGEGTITFQHTEVSLF